MFHDVRCLQKFNFCNFVVSPKNFITYDKSIHFYHKNIFYWKFTQWMTLIPPRTLWSSKSFDHIYLVYELKMDRMKNFRIWNSNQIITILWNLFFLQIKLKIQVLARQYDKNTVLDKLIETYPKAVALLETQRWRSTKLFNMLCLVTWWNTLTITELNTGGDKDGKK